MLAALASPRYFALVERLVAEAGRPRLSGATPSIWGRSSRSEYRRMRKAARRAAAEPDDASMHRLRIAGKRARYAAELAALPDDRQGQAFIRAAKDLQDVLGAHQDAVVAEERLRALAAGADYPLRSPPGASSSRRPSAAPRLEATFPTRSRRSPAPRSAGRSSGSRMLAVLVRHGVAGDRAKWDGEDRLRPLDRRGERQAAALPESLSGLPIRRILTSPAVRCVQTVEPLAAALGIEVEETPALAEGAARADIMALARRRPAPGRCCAPTATCATSSSAGGRRRRGRPGSSTSVRAA